ncbi:TetR/AcrR family transcriptional regulator [uncultured Roseibium sp.]|uniref:TetR/AcrR family transcriptional regulator n=1 Tax=uncultured Roseibium sp. TaxID=1936171 RepID=UPI0025990E8D|nr:TetR/AcrR family transcriptional regulator [uncultured Roseibium sp.]
MTEIPRQAGRPREEATAPALMDAARRLVRTNGYDKVSITQIIKEAGVSRQSLYRRWPTKADLVLEAFFESASQDASDAERHLDHGSARQRLLDLLISIFDHIARDGAAMRSLIASAQEDPQFRESFIEKFVLPREEIVTGILLQAVESGELPPHSNVAMLTAMIHGAFWYRMLNDWPLDTAFAKAMVSQIFGS